MCSKSVRMRATKLGMLVLKYCVWQMRQRELINIHVGSSLPVNIITNTKAKNKITLKMLVTVPITFAAFVSIYLMSGTSSLVPYLTSLL